MGRTRSPSPPQDRAELGAAAEELVVKHLLARGCRILDRNVRSRSGEIDIVADDHGVLAFVEVRSRRGGRYGDPAETVGHGKQGRLRRLAEAYVARRGLEGPVRFDVASVAWHQGGKIAYYDSAFE